MTAIRCKAIFKGLVAEISVRRLAIIIQIQIQTERTPATLVLRAAHNIAMYNGTTSLSLLFWLMKTNPNLIC